MRAHFGNAHWSRAWVNLCSRNNILPRSAQMILFMIVAVAMFVNARSSKHEPNQGANHDPKWLSEGDSFLCEQALSIMANAAGTPSCKALQVKVMHKAIFTKWSGMWLPRSCYRVQLQDLCGCYRIYMAVTGSSIWLWWCLSAYWIVTTYTL